VSGGKLGEFSGESSIFERESSGIENSKNKLRVGGQGPGPIRGRRGGVYASDFKSSKGAFYK
jgi:hypothetical protein